MRTILTLPLLAAPALAQAPTAEELDALDVPAIVELAEHLATELGERLTEPDREVVARYAKALDHEGAGVSRVVRSRAHSLVDAAVYRADASQIRFPVGEGTTGDLDFMEDTVRSGYVGRALGWVLYLGELPLVELAEATSAPPAALAPVRREAWNMLWRDLGAPGIADRYDERFEAMGLERWMQPMYAAGHSYLVRSRTDEHDVLAAFEIAAMDAATCTVVWCVLQTWPLGSPEVRAARSREGTTRSLPPGWMSRASEEELFAFAERLSAVVAPLALAAPAVPDRLASLVAAPDAGVARLVTDRLAAALVGTDARDLASHCFGARARIPWVNRTRFHNDFFLDDNGRMYAAHVGDWVGVVVELGGVPLERVPATADSPLDGADDDTTRLWPRMWKDLPANRSSAAAKARASWEQGLEGELRVARPTAVPGQTYLCRIVAPPTHDVLVALEVLEHDAFGYSIAWRELARFPMDD